MVSHALLDYSIIRNLLETAQCFPDMEVVNQRVVNRITDYQKKRERTEPTKLRRGSQRQHPLAEQRRGELNGKLPLSMFGVGSSRSLCCAAVLGYSIEVDG